MKKYQKKFIKIIFLIFIAININFTYGYNEEYNFNYSALGDFGAGTGPVYLGEISIDQPGELNVIFESWDCDYYNEFYLYIPGVEQAIPCSGNGNNIYIIEYGIFENVPEETGLEFYLINNTSDSRGLGQLDIYVDYIQNIDTTTTLNLNTDKDFFLGNELKIFSDTDDFRQFMMWQLGLIITILVCIILFKIFDYRKIW